MKPPLIRRIPVWLIVRYVEWAAPHYRDQDPERVDRILARAAALRARLEGTQ